MNAPAAGQGGRGRSSGNTQVPARRGERRQRSKRPKGSPMLIVLMIMVVLPSVLLADAWGAGAAGIIGGLTGMFSLVVFIGGPLRADLRVALVMGPLLIIAAAVPRLVAEASRPAAMALVVLLTFVAALLPVIGPRFANAGMGLGMTTMFGYGYAPQGAADHQQVIAAAVAGVVVALLLRILMGISDPSKPTRQEIADVLVADDPAAATATAFGTWLSDGRQRWLADALEGASRYRLALRTAKVARAGDHDAAEALRARARDLAGQLKAKPRRDEPAHDTPAAAPVPASPAGASAAHLAEAARSLDIVEQAIREHDTTAVRLDRDRRHQLGDAVLHPSARLQSIQFRHAVRAALAVLLMLLITSGLEPGDPLVSTALLSTFSILQASWGDTMTKTRNKIIGVGAGSLAVAVILLVVPHSYLVAVAAVALCLGLWYIVTRPALGAAFMVVVSVGFNAVNRDLDPVTLLLQYVGLTASAVVVGVVFGFVVIPGFRPPPLRRRIEKATAATASALRASTTGADATRPDDIVVFRDAARTQDELVPDHDRLDERQLAELDTLRTALRDLTTLAEATTLSGDELEQVLQELSPEHPAGGAAHGGEVAADDVAAASSTLRDLAQQAGSAERYLLGTLPVAR